MSEIEVSILSGPDAACDEFVRHAPGAKLCHLPTWSFAIQQSLGHRSCYLVARVDGGVRGVMPLTYIRSFLFGRRLVSEAFASYGGPLAEDDHARDALFDRAIKLARELSCRAIQFRGERELPYDLYHPREKVSMRLPLMSDPEEMWKSFKSSTKVRNHIRKAEKAGVTAALGREELLGEFYDVYTRRMAQLGTPCYPRRLFAALLEAFPDNCQIFIARMDGQTVGARMVFCFRQMVESIWGITRMEYNHYSPNHLLYWEVFQHYCVRGAKWFDFGPSPVETGSHEFKKQWGAIEVPLYYQYWLPEGASHDLPALSNQKYQRRVELWKKLPLWLTRLLGPAISRGLP
jgi:FemAB-related protein (PEP-CTERM system-associated)